MTRSWKVLEGEVRAAGIGALVLRTAGGEELDAGALLDNDWMNAHVRVCVEVGDPLTAPSRPAMGGADLAVSTAMKLISEGLTLLHGVEPATRDGLAVHFSRAGEVSFRPIDYVALGELSQRDWTMARVVADEVVKRLKVKAPRKKAPSSRKKTRR